MRPLSIASSPLVVVLVAMATAVEVVVSPITVDAAGSIRNGHNNNNPRGHQQQLLPSGRRRLLHRRNFPSGLACNLFLRDVEYGPNADKPQGYSVEEWFCELSEDDSHRLGVERPYYLDIVDASSIVPSNAIPGQSTLIATEATINFAETRLYIPTEAKVSVETRTDNTRSRNLMTTKGALDVLMVRITDNKGVAPNADLNQLRSDVFEDEVSLKSQFEACSYGKLKIRPFTGRTETNLQIRNGVVDVSVDYDIRREGDRGELQIAAIRSTEEAIGNLRHQFDVVMFCMPPGTGDWLAYAFVGDNLSFYNNEWCSYVSGQLHEVGHNLGCVGFSMLIASVLLSRAIFPIYYQDAFFSLRVFTLLRFDSFPDWHILARKGKASISTNQEVWGFRMPSMINAFASILPRIGNSVGTTTKSEQSTPSRSMRRMDLANLVLVFLR